MAASFAGVDEVGESRVWPVPEPLNAPDLGELSLRIEARSGHRMTSGPAVIPLDARAWKERLEAVARLDGPPSFDDDPSWHDPQAREAEEEGNTRAATWHLDRLAVASPGDWTLPARLGRARAAIAAFDEAAADYDRAGRLAPPGAVLDWQAQCAALAESDG